MSELRWNPLARRWVTVTPERGLRPADFRPRQPHVQADLGRPCPFCPGNEEETPPALETYGPHGHWSVRVLPNLYPAFAGDAGFSFLGVDFTETIVTRVRITAGAAAPGVDDVTQTPANPDIVAMDDFIFGEPVLVPVTFEGVALRLAQLADDVGAAVPPGKLANKLQKSLDQAASKVGKAENKPANKKTEANA